MSDQQRPTTARAILRAAITNMIDEVPDLTADEKAFMKMLALGAFDDLTEIRDAVVGMGLKLDRIAAALERMAPPYSGGGLSLTTGVIPGGGGGRG
ncbi:MAG: hypothetical protein KGL39_45005 [Patescibacteria group bacterium]|nr:hypothetical protein [Patescibacteria group bacterium]